MEEGQVGMEITNISSDITLQIVGAREGAGRLADPVRAAREVGREW